MNCSHCGAAAQSGASFCDQCGKPLVASAMSFADTQAEEPPALWNPNATANWSFLFTPAFGAYLQMRNWRALGETEKAAASKAWFYVSLGFMALVLLSGLVVNSKAADGAARGLGLVLLLAWYFGSGRAQAKYVKARFGNEYARKSWGKVLLVAFGDRDRILCARCPDKRHRRGGEMTRRLSR